MLKTSMHNELIAEIESWKPALQGQIDRTTPLISSGNLDSLGLLRLLVWIEEKLTRSIAVTEIDVVRVWDTVDLIVTFVERDGRLR